MKKINKSIEYKGQIISPVSKSFMQRVIAIATLCKGTTIINNACFCDDTTAAMDMSTSLGAKITTSANNVSITGNFIVKNKSLFAGESGLGARMFTPIAALTDEEIMLTGHGSLLSRPVSMLEKPLKQLGVKLESNNGLLPIKVRGPITGGNACVDGNTSSQVLSGLLIALPFAKKDSILEVTTLNSRPYIDITIDVLSDFGIEIINNNYKQFYIKGNQKFKNRNYTIEGDWSNAAFHLVGGAIAGDVTMTGLNIRSKQADKAILEALSLSGALISINDNEVNVKRNQLNPFNFDATQCPDLFPPLVVLAAACTGNSYIKGTSRLVHKESNRALVLKREMKNVGVNIKIKDDVMTVEGGHITGGKIHSNNDHRIAMSGSIAGLISDSEIKIQEPDAVNKSYPEFYSDFRKLIHFQKK